MTRNRKITIFNIAATMACMSACIAGIIAVDLCSKKKG